MNVETVSTGALALDRALGVGGLPRGRVVEIFGPESSGKSTLAMHVVAEAQRNGGICAYIDAEHAMDPVYASAIGLNIDDLLISQPDTGEQALEIADMLIRSGALDVLVIDSVAALTPRAEIEGEMGDSHVGLQARLMSQALRKITATLNRSNTVAIFINQLREKIGVIYGCLSYGTRATLADGTQEKIGKIVNQKLPVEVLSYDAELDAIVPKKVVNWFDNGRTEQFLQFTVARPGGNGRAQFACTPNHKIRTPGGWREAQELSVDDRVLQAVPHYLSDFQWEVLMGGLMGDGALSPSRSEHGARYRFGHGAKQVEYCDWKASLFANIGTCRWTNADGAVYHEVHPLPELAAMRQAVYVGGKKVLSEEYLKRLTPLSLAFWYMDDGTFSLFEPRVCRSALGRGAGAPRSASTPWRRARENAWLHTSPTRGASLPSSSSRAHEGLHPPVFEGRDGQAPCPRRPVRPSFDGIQAPSPVPRALRGGAGVRPDASGVGAHARHRHRPKASVEEHPPLRHRGGGHPQLLCRRRHGAQLARSHAGWSGPQVLLLCAVGHPSGGVHQERRRGGGQPHQGQGGEEQSRSSLSRSASSTSCTARASAGRAR